MGRVLGITALLLTWIASVDAAEIKRTLLP
jgi:hypothetical protein